jgi:hypothetical protein
MSLIAGNLGFVQRLLDEHRLTWGVFGGAAAHLYGDRRPIQDVDILVAPGQLNTVVAHLQRAQKAVQFDGQRIIWRGIKLFDDLTLRKNGSIYPFQLDAPMRAHLRQMPLLGARVSLLAPEDVLTHKVLLGRGPEQGKHDLSDAEAIARRQALDSRYLRERLTLCRAGESVYTQLQSYGIELAPDSEGL